ncbi:MAG: tRNA (cytidine(34)-2'-O)-methyltransferase [Clostridiales bacterium]|nr:tRNA (cytidine(34)-2'-O)-methyltransferase [Clostridiales bacterium]
MHIVLLEPEIPHNTGAIGRTCSITGSTLHLIKPLGFSVGEKDLRRAGLDYWHELTVYYYENYAHFKQQNPGAKIFMATTKALNKYTDVHYDADSYILFGKESAGIPEALLLENRESCIRIPMKPNARSLNLANAAAVVLYEALRQNDFPGLEGQGRLHRNHW